LSGATDAEEFESSIIPTPVNLTPASDGARNKTTASIFLDRWLTPKPFFFASIFIFNMASVVVDDPSPQFTYNGGIWSTSAQAHFFGGSSTWPGFALASDNSDTGVYGSLTFYFQGTCPSLLCCEITRNL
jgi:hypothetical protein